MFIDLYLEVNKFLYEYIIYVKIYRLKYKYSDIL